MAKSRLKSHLWAVSGLTDRVFVALDILDLYEDSGHPKAVS
jgi:hypothetical protein